MKKLAISIVTYLLSGCLSDGSYTNNSDRYIKAEFKTSCKSAPVDTEKSLTDMASHTAFMDPNSTYIISEKSVYCRESSIAIWSKDSCYAEEEILKSWEKDIKYYKNPKKVSVNKLQEINVVGESLIFLGCIYE